MYLASKVLKNQYNTIHMKRLRDYLKPCAKAMAFGFAIKASGTVLELMLPNILSRIIDDAVPAKDSRQIIILMGVMVVCALGAWFFNVYANRRATAVARDVTKNIRHDLFEKTLYLSCEKTDEFTIPSLESRLTSDTYNLHRMITMMQRLGVRAPIITVGGLVMTFLMDPALAGVFLAVIPFMLVLVYLRATKSVPLYAKVQKAADKMTAVVRENSQGIRVIKALSRMDYEKNRYEGVNNNLRDQEMHANLVMAIINPSMNLLLYLGMIGVIIVGAYRVNSGVSEAGKILAFISYFQLISRSLLAISRMFIMYSKGMASAQRIMEVLNTESEKEWAVQEYPAGDPQYSISFDHVTFSYLHVRNNVEDIDFHLKKGETLGLIGATGSGKTTLLSLLLHFYDAGSGAIYINGKDIRSIEPSDLRSMFGVVMQNDFLFADTIDENIRFGRKVDSENITEAISAAQAEEFVSKPEDGTLHMLTTKGTNLSGGQRQRVLLSRAFAAKPEFLLLDDSSSALDYKTDAALRKALAEKYPDTTMIIVAQRVSAVMGCDQIIVMDHGRVSGHGTHEELMAGNALYASIAESQMGGALFD